MMIFIHVAIALASIGWVSYAYARPTAKTLHIVYGLVASTLFTGFLLVWSEPAHMIQACTSGVMYIAIISAGIIAARRKLVTRVSDNI